jgi:hypothetical protein
MITPMSSTPTRSDAGKPEVMKAANGRRPAENRRSNV